MHSNHQSKRRYLSRAAGILLMCASVVCLIGLAINKDKLGVLAVWGTSLPFLTFAIGLQWAICPR
jgi:hypothetical protein